MGRKVIIDSQGNERILELNSNETNAKTNQSINIAKSVSQNNQKNNNNNQK